MRRGKRCQGPVRALLARPAVQAQGRSRFHHPSRRGPQTPERTGGGKRPPLRAVSGHIRQALMKENLLDSVVGLSAKLFITAGIPAAVLVFDRLYEEDGKNTARKDMLLIDVSEGVHARQDAEPAGPGVYHQDTRDLRDTHSRGETLAPDQAPKRLPRTTPISISPAMWRPSGPRRRVTLPPPCKRRSAGLSRSWPRRGFPGRRRSIIEFATTHTRLSAR